MNAPNQHQQDRVRVAYQALISMNSLSAEEREQVLGTLTRISTLPPEQWPKDRIRLWRPGKGLYRLDATDQLRVYFTRAEDGSILIEDLAMQEMLDRYFPAGTSRGES